MSGPYPITPALLPAPSKHRSGQRIGRVLFIVAHDTGNESSTAKNNVDYYTRTAHDESASAHLFVDDREIRECVPALTGPPEKAWHVQRQRPEDNQRFGADSNDAAIGVELCYGPKLDAQAAYTRYVWTLAELCRRFSLNPATQIAGHFQLDPARRSDPVNALGKQGRTFDGLLLDVAAELRGVQAAPVAPAAVPGLVPFSQPVRQVTVTGLNLRALPNVQAPILRTAPAGAVLLTSMMTEQGDAVNGNARWFGDGNTWWWSGGVRVA